MLFTALVAACAMTACGTKTTETAAAAEEATREIGSSDIAYVQVEAVLADMTREEKVLQLFMITPEALTGHGTVTEAKEKTQEAI